ncbi:CRAL-TRIO domain-containing protein [Mucor lusitanicus]|uniref:CRAL-TRIO domain-containing protein n=1 Tax=Mucor circinelloides f. lusitanicus TaxID=29924 RepID=A0A8H4F2D5_MUCCL|nr:CRAL-TRIO domain-containing protein [Mucor lusitanicus]
MAIQTITAAEKESVAKLKAKLTDIKQAAQVSEGYKLWDIALDQESTDPRLDVLLVKFIRARESDLTKATQMLTDTLIWRKDFGADNLLDEAIDDSVLGSVSYIYKTDKEGRPVCYNFYGDIDQEKVFGDKDKFIRWRVQVMERGVQLIDFVNTDSMVVIHDYKNASLFGRSSNAKTATKEIIKIMQDNYPEFLAAKLFVNVPYWGAMIFKLVRPLLSEATTKKFVVCSNDELYQSLTNIIDEANLPKDYQKTNSTKEKEIPIASKQEQEKIEKAPSADITTSEAAAAAAPVTDVPVGPESKITEEPITKVEPTTTAADATAEGTTTGSEAAIKVADIANDTNNTATTAPNTSS